MPRRTLVLADKIDAISLKTIHRLGVQRTSLSRELNKMRKDGLIEYDARTITLKSYMSRHATP